MSRNSPSSSPTLRAEKPQSLRDYNYTAAMDCADVASRSLSVQGNRFDQPRRGSITRSGGGQRRGTRRVDPEWLKGLKVKLTIPTCGKARTTHREDFYYYYCISVSILQPPNTREWPNFFGRFYRIFVVNPL